MQSVSPSTDAPVAFRLSKVANDKRAVELLLQPHGSLAPPVPIWSRRFEAIDDRGTLFTEVNAGRFDAVFLGRLTMLFGRTALDEVADRLIAADRIDRAEKQKEAAERARDRFIVNLYAREGKHGRHVLELQRRSSKEAEWSVTYDRAVERDRLCDWLRWQKERFLSFLDYAAEHGGEALSRTLIDEMFVTERRVKKEGRGAGGMRPLRMWRGD